MLSLIPQIKSKVTYEDTNQIRGWDDCGNPITPWNNSDTVSDFLTISITKPPPPIHPPATIPITINASYTGSGAMVTLGENGYILTTFMSSPYSYTWSNVPAGVYSLQASVTYENEWSTSALGLIYV